MTKTLVFIPSYNDHFHIDEIVEYILNLSDRHLVLVVDDGSALPIKIKSGSKRVYSFRIPYNSGLGIGLNIALDFAKSKNIDVLVRIDSDGQHPLSDLNSLATSLKTQNKDISLGCRKNADLTDGFVNILKTICKKYMTFILWFLVGIKAKDPHTGFYAISKNGIEKMSNIFFNRYPETQLLLEAKAAGLTIGSIDIYSKEREHDSSSIRFWDAIFILLRFHVSVLDYFIKKVI